MAIFNIFLESMGKCQLVSVLFHVWTVRGAYKPLQKKVQRYEIAAISRMKTNAKKHDGNFGFRFLSYFNLRMVTVFSSLHSDLMFSSTSFDS